MNSLMRQPKKGGAIMRINFRTFRYGSIFLMLTACAFAQDLIKPQRGDTVLTKSAMVDPFLRIDRQVLLLPLFDELAITPGYYSSIIFQPSAPLADIFSRKEVEIIDLSLPWKLQLARQAEYKTLYSILGAVEAGGVGYLAYKHIQKYGWK